MSSIQYKFAITVNGKTFMYPSMDEAMKMAKFVGAKLSDIKEVHVF